MFALPGCLLLPLLLAGCGPEEEVYDRLTVRGGPSLDPLFAEIVPAYEEKYPDAVVISHFSCAPCVLYRSGKSRPELDVFVSIGDFEMELLRKKGELRFSESATIGHTSLSLVVPERMGEIVRGIPDLHSEEVKHIGVGDPDNAAVGHYARKALDKKRRLWSELEDRFVFKDSGCEIMKLVSLDREVDAAIVFSVCMSEGGGKIRHVTQFPDTLIPPVPLIAGVTSDSKNPAEAKRFVQFLGSDEVKPILKRHHVLLQEEGEG